MRCFKKHTAYSMCIIEYRKATSVGKNTNERRPEAEKCLTTLCLVRIYIYGRKTAFVQLKGINSKNKSVSSVIYLSEPAILHQCDKIY